MNDDIIIINAYPNTIEREAILKNCIKQLKKTNIEIMLVTHYPVKREIQQLVDYFIYDIRNPMLEESMIWWYGNDKFYLQTSSFNIGSASYTVLLSIQNGVYLAKSLGKKMFYYFEYDCRISDEDLKKITSLKQELYKKKKKGYVQIYTHGGDIKNKGIGMLFFIFEVDFYIEKINMVYTREEFKKSVKNGIALEFYFYQRIYKYMSELYIEEEIYIRDFFPNSDINLSSYESSYFIDILPEQKNRKSVLVIMNRKDDVEEYKLVFINDDNNGLNKFNISVSPDGYYYNILNDKIKTVKIFYKKNDNWKLIYDKKPNVEVNRKKEIEYIRINNEE